MELFKARFVSLSMQGAYESGMLGHPQNILKAIGIKAMKHVPQTMGDCWDFWNCKDIPEKLPEYISVRPFLSPIEVRWGLSEKEAVELWDSKEFENCEQEYYKCEDDDQPIPMCTGKSETTIIPGKITSVSSPFIMKP